MEPAVRALQDFAPDMALRIEDGTIDRFSKVNFKARTGASGVDLELSAASPFWKRLAVDGRVEYADLAARARVAVDGLVLDADVPATGLRAELRTDGKSVIECDFDATVGSLASAKGRLVVPANRLAVSFEAVDLPQALAIARRKVPNLDAIEAAEGRLSATADVQLGPPWQAQIDSRVQRDRQALRSAVEGFRAGGARDVKQRQSRRRGGAIGLLRCRGAYRAHRPDAPLGGLRKATLKLEQWFPWLRTKAPLDDVASLSGSVDVALNRLALRFDRLAEAEFDAVVTPRKVSAGLRALPEPVHLAGGTIRADAKRVRLAGRAGAIGASTSREWMPRSRSVAPRLAAASGRHTQARAVAALAAHQSAARRHRFAVRQRRYRPQPARAALRSCRRTSTSTPW